METILHNPGNYLVVETVTCFVSVDEEGNEGIMGANLGIGWMPFIGADEEKISQLYPIAKDLSERYKVPFKVIQLSTRADITDVVKSKFDKSDGR